MKKSLPLIGLEDIQRLRGGDVDGKVDVVSKIAVHYKSNTLAPTELKIAEEIFRIAALEGASMVQKILVDSLADYPGLSREIARDLIKHGDIYTVAIPFLKNTESLTDRDLLEIIELHCPQRQKAIASRKHVSTRISEALIDKGIRDVVAVLTANIGAQISETGYNKILDKFPEDDGIKGNLAVRPKLPPAFVERLVVMVAGNLREQLVAKYNIDPELARQAVSQAQERATLTIIHPGAPDSYVERLIKHLKLNHRLTDSLIFRSICSGDTRFFAYALSERSGLPVMNIRHLLNEGGDDVMRKLYQKSGIHKTIADLMSIALVMYRETRNEIAEEDYERFSRRLLERLLTNQMHLDSDNLDHLVDRLMQSSKNSALSWPV